MNKVAGMIWRIKRSLSEFNCRVQRRLANLLETEAPCLDKGIAAESAESRINGFKQYLVKYWAWIPIGFIMVFIAVGISVYAATRDAGMDLPLRSPQYEVRPVQMDFNVEDNPVYTADDGVVVIPIAAQPTVAEPTRVSDPSDTEAIWKEDKVVTYNSFTTQDTIKQEDGSLGVLSIPKINLGVNVYQAEDEMESMTKGAAHFAYTSVWDGNVGVCAHNVNFDLSDGYFKNLHLLKKGDEIRYSTTLGERIYTVSKIAEISEDDWSYLGRTPDNRITMITCISGKPTKRLMVQAVEK